MKLAYFGTPQFSADFLGKILTDPDLRSIEVVLVVTQPDKPVGRKQTITPTPVKVLAQSHNLHIITTLPDPSSEHYKALAEADVALVYAYGRIIPAEILALPKLGFWNIHPSLLPKYRGASPTAYPLLNGDTSTGVTLMQMDEKMDHGAIISQEKYEIGVHEKRPDLERELTKMGFEMFKTEILRSAQNDRKEQDHSQATFTKLLKKDDGFVELDDVRSALQENGSTVYNKFRGFFPWPGIWTKVGDKRMKITDCTLQESKLVINKVQFEGKTETNFNTQMILSS
ncbi:MAG: methionyl-tRNA formyltransferase [Microgenomates group bacterium]